MEIISHTGWLYFRFCLSFRDVEELLLERGATVHRARCKTDSRSRWIQSLEQRRGKNIATVAIANKNARIAWALLTSDAEYRKAA